MEPWGTCGLFMNIDKLITLLEKGCEIQSGCGRVGIITDDVVYKIPVNINGALQCKDELRKYFKERRNRKYLAKILDCSCGIITMERLWNTVVKRKGVVTPEIFDTINLYERIQIGEDKQGNLKLYDYADTRLYGDKYGSFRDYTRQDLIDYLKYINTNNIALSNLLLEDYLKEKRNG